MTTEPLTEYIVYLKMSGTNKDDIVEQLESLDSYDLIKIEDSE